MRQVGVRQFKDNFYNEIKDLPLQVTKYDEPILNVSAPNGVPYKKVEVPKKKPKVDTSMMCTISFCPNPAVKQRSDGRWVCEDHS